jgi:uncharacterized membrane protein YfcA
MSHASFIVIAAVFALAGFVKGLIGLGLPTISMGLLAVVMPPVEAAALLLLPSLVTNVWQAASGPSLRRVLWRLRAMMVAVCLGTWAGAGLMTGPSAHYGTLFLGIALALYALSGLTSFRLAVPKRQETLFGAAAGAITGIITAATGVFVIPAVPYLEAIGLEKEELVQALGLSFTVSTLALAVNIGMAGALDRASAGTAIMALAAALSGMAAGQAIRRRLSQTAFRRWFFIGLLVLGLYLAFRP